MSINYKCEVDTVNFAKSTSKKENWFQFKVFHAKINLKDSVNFKGPIKSWHYFEGILMTNLLSLNEDSAHMKICWIYKKLALNDKGSAKNLQRLNFSLKNVSKIILALAEPWQSLFLCNWNLPWSFHWIFPRDSLSSTWKFYQQCFFMYLTQIKQSKSV